jgi:hypothetical protein
VKNALSLVFRTCAAGAFALLVSANASASVVFRGAIDPIFGLGITGLSYSGEAFFNVADDCLDVSQDGTHDPNADTCGGLLLLSASITLTNSVTLGTQTLTFWPDPSFFPSDPITAYVIQNGTLGAVDTLHIGEQIVDASPDVGYAGPLWLQLFHTGAAGDGLVGNATLFTGTCPEGCFEDGRQANTATVTITQVPEPGTVALLMVAMTAGWIVRRRRSSGR